MKQLMYALVSAACVSHAAVEVISPERWTLYRGTTIVQPRQDFMTKADCVAAAPLDTQHRCVGTETFIRRADAPTCPPPPGAETRAQTCPAGTTGTWSQSRSYAAAPHPTCATAGAWMPASAPAGACVPVVTPPAGTLSATRTRGPAPLAVMFEAAGDFHGTYAFDFGDPQSGAWPVSGKSRNIQVGGPIAAHVFETPGTYTVTAAGASVQIVVEDPAAAYAGTKTVCVGAAFDGCPAGAEQRASLPADYDGKRVLLRRGQSFGAITLPLTADAVQIGAYGSGEKPVVQSVTIGAQRPLVADWPDEITVMDLKVTGGILQEGGATRLLFLRLTMDGPAPANNRIHLSRAVSYWAFDDANRKVAQDQFQVPREIFVVDNRIIGNTSTADSPLHNVTMSGSRMAVMGNELSQAWEHNIRLYTAHKVFIGHNAVRGRSSDGGRHSLKIHSAGTGAYSDRLIDARNRASSRIVIADNLFGDPADNNAWTVAVRPQSESYGEGIEDVVIENNRFIRGTRTSSDIVLVGRRMTVRGNGAASVLRHSGSYPLPAGWIGPYWIGN
jgi:hypothetical protein